MSAARGGKLAFQASEMEDAAFLLLGVAPGCAHEGCPLIESFVLVALLQQTQSTTVSVRRMSGWGTWCETWACRALSCRTHFWGERRLMLEYFPSDPESPCAASSLRVSTCIRMITSRGLHSCEMHLSPTT